MNKKDTEIKEQEWIYHQMENLSISVDKKDKSMSTKSIIKRLIFFKQESKNVLEHFL